MKEARHWQVAGSETRTSKESQLNTILPHGGGNHASPFDEIRRVTPEGREYWSARDLMPILGYERWERFADAIGRAKVSAHNSGYVVSDHFPGAAKMVETGSGAHRRIDDYHLSRYGCYVVALNGDPRKPEIAAAQNYFVIKTREAETQVPAALPTPREYALMLIRSEDAREAAEAEAKMLAARIEKDAPLVAKAEAHTGSDSSVHRQEFAREVITWGLRQKNIVIKQADVLRFLGHIGLFIRGERTDTGHATADALKRGLAFTDKGTARNGHAWATGKLTARGQDYAWKKITAHVEANGTLELPRELRGGEPA